MSDTAYTLADQQRMSAARNYFAWQGRLVLPEIGQRIIEVGCGIGNFTGMLLDRECVVAVDVEPRCLARLGERYVACGPSLYAVLGDVEKATFCALADVVADTCVCLNVLEHIEDHVGALQRMASILTPGGVIVLLVPAFPALYGPIDAKLGHYRRYTKKSLRQAATLAGLTVKKAHYVNAIGFFGWWVNSRILRHEEQSARQIAVFDRYVVPPMFRIEALVPPPFGQSLFAVLRCP